MKLTTNQLKKIIREAVKDAKVNEDFGAWSHSARFDGSTWLDHSKFVSAVKEMFAIKVDELVQLFIDEHDDLFDDMIGPKAGADFTDQTMKHANLLKKRVMDLIDTLSSNLIYEIMKK